MSIEDVTTEIRRGKGNRRDFVVTADVITTERMYQEGLGSLVADVSVCFSFFVVNAMLQQHVVLPFIACSLNNSRKS